MYNAIIRKKIVENLRLSREITKDTLFFTFPDSPLSLPSPIPLIPEPSATRKVEVKSAVSIVTPHFAGRFGD